MKIYIAAGIKYKKLVGIMDEVVSKYENLNPTPLFYIVPKGNIF